MTTNEQKLIRALKSLIDSYKYYTYVDPVDIPEIVKAKELIEKLENKPLTTPPHNTRIWL